MLLKRALKPPGTNNGFGMATLRQLAEQHATIRLILGPHWQDILSPQDKMSIAEVKALMNPDLIKELEGHDDAGR